MGSELSQNSIIVLNILRVNSIINIKIRKEKMLPNNRGISLAGASNLLILKEPGVKRKVVSVTKGNSFARSIAISEL